MRLLQLTKFKDMYIFGPRHADGFIINPGDTLTLVIDDKTVHATPLHDKVQRITCFAVVEVPGGFGYFVGDDELYNFFSTWQK